MNLDFVIKDQHSALITANAHLANVWEVNQQVVNQGKLPIEMLIALAQANATAALAAAELHKSLGG